MTEPSTAVATVDPDAGKAVATTSDHERRMSALMRDCKTLAKSDLVPKALKDKPDNIFALALYGQTFGLDPIHSIQRIYLIQGTFEPKAEVLAGVILRAGHELRWDEVSAERCTVSIRRAGTDYWQTTTWTIDQARKAGLLDVWVERRVEDGKWPDGNKKYKTEAHVVGDDTGIFTPEERAKRGLGDIPQWAADELKKGEVKRKDPWFAFPDDMLAAKALRRGAKRVVPDAVLGLGDDTDRVDDYAPAAVLARVDEPTAVAAPDDDEPVEGELIDSPTPEDGGGADEPIVDAEEVPTAPVDDEAARGKAMRKLMATCGDAFPETDAPKGEKTKRQRLLRRAAQYAVFKEHRSAKDLTAAELAEVDAWVYANFVSDSAVTHLGYEILDDDVVRFTLGDRSKDVPPPPADDEPVAA